MTNPNLTHIATVIDQSGSMTPLRNTTISAFNEFIEEQRRQPGRATVGVTLFNTRLSVLHVATPIGDLPKLTLADYNPNGMTALFDAVGTTIDRLGEALTAKPEHERPGKVIVMIQTDGMENSSTDYIGSRVREMIARQEREYAWAFLFLGAGQDAWANSLGVPAGSTISYASGDPGQYGKAMRASTVAVSTFRSGGVTGQSLTGTPGGLDLRDDDDEE